MLMEVIKDVGVWTLCAIGLILVIRRYFESRLSSQRLKLAALCISYLALIGTFGHVYHYLYRRNQNRFAFVSEVADRRRLEITDARDIEKKRLLRLLAALNQLPTELESGQVLARISRADDNLIDVDTGRFHYDFEFDATWSAPRDGKLIRGGRLVIADDSGAQILADPFAIIGPDISLQKRLPKERWNAITDSYFPPNLADKAGEIVAPIRAKTEAALGQLEAATDAANATRSEQWTYIDFLYFSTITQATVGYGDILPNSSIVRIFVIIQVLIGLMLFGVGISWLTANDKPSKAPVSELTNWRGL